MTLKEVLETIEDDTVVDIRIPTNMKVRYKDGSIDWYDMIWYGVVRKRMILFLEGQVEYHLKTNVKSVKTYINKGWRSNMDERQKELCEDTDFPVLEIILEKD